MSTNKTVAADIRKAATEWLAGGLKSFKGDKSMTSAYRKDAADLKMLAKLVAAGTLTYARDKAAGLDTIVRDEIPESFFTLLADNNIEW